MCTVCGCSNQTSEAPKLPRLHFGEGPAGTSLPGVSQTRTITLERNILDANNRIADQNRAHFKSHGIRAVNLLSSPGSGKTTLLCRTLEALKNTPTQVSVIEGDQQTTLDAERIQATGAPVVQVNTGKGCHLDARMVSEAFAQLHRHDQHHHQTLSKPQLTPLPLDALNWQFTQRSELLFIENVGNLVCPALWDLGEEAKVVILSVTEGEDKPLKYPDMFQRAQLLLINKIDLLPHVDFSPERALQLARQINPGLECLQVSATTGEGMADWIRWLRKDTTSFESPRPEETALLDRIKALEAELLIARAALLSNE